MNLKQLAKPIALRASQLLRIRQSESALTQASGRYWTGSDNDRFKVNSHWRGEHGDGLSDDAWSAVGQRHLDLYRQLAPAGGFDLSPKRVVEWGCGGGANVVPFARDAETFVGVDVSEPTLAECRRQMEAEGLVDCFRSELANVDDPEAAADRIRQRDGGFDLFLCVYVFELIPGPDYAKRLLRIAASLLRPGGAAFVQFKYDNGDWRSRPRRWAYGLNLANTTTLAIDGFWTMSQEAGLTPLAVSLLPKDDLVGDERYAYTLLRKPESSADESAG